MTTPIKQSTVMRALSHPTRIALLEALQAHPTLTATAAGELIGETSTNCAFHLRTLAKFGFVEEVGGGAGRRRPWRLTDQAVTFSDVHDDEETSLAANQLADILIGHWLRRIGTVQADRHHEPAEWREVLGGSQAVATATPAEIQQLVDEVRTIFDRFKQRSQTAEAPPGARPVELFLFAQPFRPGE